MYNFSTISKRIKKNEGFSNTVYKDQLGFLTIGYGHLITPKDKFVKKKKYSKKVLDKLFCKDLKKAIKNFEKNLPQKTLPNNVEEIIIEMIFQLGIKGFKKFKKFNYHILKKEYYMAALEMVKSRWYKQTPNRVHFLIKKLLNNNAKR